MKNFMLFTAFALCNLLGQGVAAQTTSNTIPNAQLLVAARHGDLKAVERAPAQGAAPNSRNRLGKSPLLLAAEKVNLELAELML